MIDELPEPFRLLTANLEAVVYVAHADEARSPISIGASAERNFGFTSEELQGEPELFLRHVHPDDVERVRQERREASSAAALVTNYRLIHANGRIMYCRDTQVMVDGAGLVAGASLDATELELPTRTLHAALAAGEPRGAAQAICETMAEGLGLTWTLYVDLRAGTQLECRHGPLGRLLEARWDSPVALAPWVDELVRSPTPRWSATEGAALLPAGLRARWPGMLFGVAIPLIPDGQELPRGLLLGLSPHEQRLSASLIRTLPQLGRQAAVALQRAELLDALLRTGRERQQLADALMRAHEDQRSQLARELHDGAGQTLTAVAIQLDLVERATPLEARPALERARLQIQRTLEDLRRLSHALRPAALDDLGLVDALDEMAQALNTEQLSVIVERTAPLPPISGETATALFRIAQAALTNVVRHARATTVRVRLQLVEAEGQGRPARLRLDLSDNGCGIDGPDPKGIGLLTMRERAVALGGRFTIESAPGSGTRICVELPLG